MGIKSSDLHVAYGCAACHDAVDGRKDTPFGRDFIRLAFFDGMVRTQKILIDKGLVIIK